MTVSEFVSVLGLCFSSMMQWFYQVADLYSAYAILASVVALFVLGLVVDLFKYIIPRR